MKRGDQADRRLDVGRVAGLDAGVHVAGRDRDAARRSRPRRRAGGSRCRCRPGWRRGTGAGSRARRRSRVSRSTRAGEPMALASMTRMAVPMPRRVVGRPGRRAGAVVGRAGVDGQGDLRAHPRRGHPRAAQAHLLLHRRRRDHLGGRGPRPPAAPRASRTRRRGRRALPGHQVAQRAEGRVCAWPCRRAAPAPSRARPAGPRRSRGRSPPGPWPLLLGRAGAPAVVPTTPSRSSRPRHPHPLAHQGAGVPAADRDHPEEAAVVHVGDHQPDLVHVGGEHQPRRRRPRVCP